MEKIIDYISSDLDLNYHRFNSHGYAQAVRLKNMPDRRTKI